MVSAFCVFTHVISGWERLENMVFCELEDGLEDRTRRRPGGRSAFHESYSDILLYGMDDNSKIFQQFCLR